MLGESVINAGLTHSRALMPAVDALFDAVGLSPVDVDLIAAVTGPGSFTGVRIGVCAAKGLAMALNKPCAAVDALEALAKGTQHEGFICPLFDARRGQVYTALFEKKEGVLLRLCEDVALPLADWLERLAGYETVLFTGDGLDVCEEVIRRDAKCKTLFADGAARCLKASSACLLAEACPETHMDAAKLAPLYLRLSQAERERSERLTRQRA